jgi:hypothetical protein
LVVRARRVRPAHQALRGWLFAISSTSLAIAAHGVAGGGLPDAALTIPITAVIALGAGAIMPLLRGVLSLTAVLGLVQYSLHFLLTESVHSHSGQPAPASNGWLMFAGHALATVCTAALLSRASSALLRSSSALAWLRGRVAALLSPPVFAPATLGVISAAPVRPGQLLEVHLRRVHSRRGPPIGS